jgi:hypothetical protein
LFGNFGTAPESLRRSDRQTCKLAALGVVGGDEPELSAGPTVIVGEAVGVAGCVTSRTPSSINVAPV